MGGNKKDKGSKSKKRPNEVEVSTGKSAKLARKPESAILHPKQPLPESTQTKTKGSIGAKTTKQSSKTVSENISGNKGVNSNSKGNSASENNNAVPHSNSNGSRSRTQSQESIDRARLRDLRDEIKARTRQNADTTLINDGLGNEGCSYQTQAQAQSKIPKRITRNSEGKQREVERERNRTEPERTQFYDNNEDLNESEDNFNPERTEFDDNDVRDPDGVSLSVSEDEYAEEDRSEADVSQAESQGKFSDSESEDEEQQSSSDSSSSSDEEATFIDAKIRKKVKKDPNYQRVLKSLVDEKMKKKKMKRKMKKKNKKGMVTITSNNNTPQRRVASSPFIKSPSDSTLYTPALRRLAPGDQSSLGTLRDHLNPNSNDVIEKISNFVESIRLEGSAKKSSDKQSTPAGGRKRSREADSREEEEQRAKKVADRIILESEKFKANLVAPTGMLPLEINSDIELLRKLDNDDDFFHISCHIEPCLRAKIERGEFIELDKLLPDDKTGGMANEHDNRLGLIHEGGEMFLAPARKTSKINSIRKWDSAFRIYATIFTQANPHRASELLQYVQIIHTAAANNPWDNVAHYDFTFRQLMATKPWRSWAKTYTQGWSIAFSHSNNNNNGNSGSFQSRQQNFNSKGNSNSGNNNNNNRRQGGQRTWKDDCCWRYGKNRCSKSASECNWDHRCTFCGGWNHSYNDCKKRGGRRPQGGAPQAAPSTSRDNKGGSGQSGQYKK